MPKYLIPAENIENLTKQVNHIRNKGASIVFELGEEKMVEDKDIEGSFHKYVEVEVEGKYIINGWEFVATIEHTPNGNIIRAINDDYRIPDRYKNVGPECEHCHRIRDRKDTYLVYNKEKDEWKQVGKTCLKDYTGGLDAGLCATMATFLKTIEEARDDIMIGSYNNYFDANEVKKYAYSLVKAKGYIPKTTVEKLREIIVEGKHRDDYKPATEEELKEIDEWVETLPTNEYGYFRNAILAWKLNYVEPRDLALISSLIGTYFKIKNQREKEKINRETTNFVGQVNDKINIKIKSFRVLYTKDNRVYGYNAPTSYVYEIIDDKGNVYIWDTPQLLEGVIEITARIKKHNEYRGTRQTIITRGKITKTKNKKDSDEKNPHYSVSDAIDKLFQDDNVDK